MKNPGKTSSLFFKYLAGFFVIASSIIALINNNLTFEVAGSIAILGFTIAEICFPVDISKIIEKFTGVKE